MRLVGIVVVVLGAFTAVSYPIGLWWDGQVLAHELRELTDSTSSATTNER